MHDGLDDNDHEVISQLFETDSNCLKPGALMFVY